GQNRVKIIYFTIRLDRHIPNHSTTPSFVRYVHNKISQLVLRTATDGVNIFDKKVVICIGSATNNNSISKTVLCNHAINMNIFGIEKRNASTPQYVFTSVFK